MVTKFKLFELNEIWVVTSVSLSSNGINQEIESIVIRKHVADFDSEIEAVDFINVKENQPDNPEHGYEIVRTLSYG